MVLELRSPYPTDAPMRWQSGSRTRPQVASNLYSDDSGLDADGAVPAHIKLDDLHILVVDDEVDARELFAMVLRSTSARVSMAGSVDEALLMFVRERPDIIVSDIGMPGQDGYSLIRRVRALSEAEGGRAPAVALTAFTGPEHRARALSAGFTMHVPKPVDPDRLIDVVTQLAVLLQAR